MHKEDVWPYLVYISAKLLIFSAEYLISILTGRVATFPGTRKYIFIRAWKKPFKWFFLIITSAKCSKRPISNQEQVQTATSLIVGFNLFATNAPLPYSLKTLKSSGYLMFSGGTEVEQWLKRGLMKIIMARLRMFVMK